MQELNLLVVDDDELVVQSIQMALPEQWTMRSAASPEGFENRLKESFQAALIDMHLTGNLAQAEGVELIRQLHQRHPRLEIIAMSGNLDRDLMERCLRAGASRFLAKPLSVEELRLTLDKIEALDLLQRATQRGQKGEALWVGQSPRAQEIQLQIASLRGETGPILIEGESGTGKEVVARLIHSQRPSRDPFIAINVAGIPDGLFESEFFGHVRGAFTGAEQNKMGLAEAAHGGDLFLDEIEALPLHQQVKLLRFLESGEVRRVGAKDSILVQVRVLAASNRPLEQMVKNGEFREDLFWRLGGRRLQLPPLRERQEDIGPLCSHFLALDRARHKQLTPDALEALGHYSWPGNVRELKRVCEQLLVAAPLPLIRREDVEKLLQPLGFSEGPASGDHFGPLDMKQGLSELSHLFEGFVVQRALDMSPDIDGAAQLLKVSRSNLYKKIKDHNLNVSEKTR